jgi:hypothetical protein
MLRTFAATVIFALAFPMMAFASDRAEDLADALGIPGVIDIMRTEGIAYGAGIEDELFPGRGGAAWGDVLDRIYSPASMEEVVTKHLAADLDDTQIEELTGFFTSERGQKIIELELTARRAFLDADVEAAAQDLYGELVDKADPRIDQIERFIAANDLVESNVMGAMNSNYAFYLGLVDGKAFDGGLTEEDILADVWSQEDGIRVDTEIWVNGYLALAYQQLASDDLEAYIALSETQAGKALNRALFEGFDEMYVTISRALGVTAAEFMKGQDI